MRRALFFLALGALVLAGPLSAAAQPAGRVVLAQGIDPTTLDPHNHQEAPAANVLLNIYDTLLFSRAGNRRGGGGEPLRVTPEFEAMLDHVASSAVSPNQQLNQCRASAQSLEVAARIAGP